MDHHWQAGASFLGQGHQVGKDIDADFFSSPPLPTERLGSDLNKIHEGRPVQLGRQRRKVRKTDAQGLD